MNEYNGNNYSDGSDEYWERQIPFKYKNKLIKWTKWNPFKVVLVCIPATLFAAIDIIQEYYNHREWKRCKKKYFLWPDEFPYEYPFWSEN
jgi:hypothetical protein